jgi:hypothetical protein
MKTGPRPGRSRSSLETGEYRAEARSAQGKPDYSADSAPLREMDWSDYEHDYEHDYDDEHDYEHE